MIKTQILKNHVSLKTHSVMLLCLLCLASCGGNQSVKPASAPPAASKPAPSASAQTAPSATKSGGYYLDDGPGDNPPKNIDSIPNAVPKKEPLLDRANKPYKALDAVYTPMTSYKPYKERGVASWYGKRYHGKNTSSGEVYDMYSMTAAHTTLPLPSYVKVSNPANGRWVIVRVNDRGPFKSNRVIDLSYAAAYKLRFASAGSTLVDVEAIDPNNFALYAADKTMNSAPAPAALPTSANTQTIVPPATSTKPIAENSAVGIQYFVQAGAFRSQANADALTKKIQSYDIATNVGINSVYNNGLYRLKLGPFDNKQDADQAAASIRKQLNTSAIIITQ
ncbi:MAG: septal ring lytic transglycosylase RlpA family protein [Bdellovibrio sp.]|nr:septal ring lytic transglycosylase RlpA family protein [Methylotenera sp.]